MNISDLKQSFNKPQESLISRLREKKEIEEEPREQEIGDLTELESEINELKRDGFSLKEIHEAIDEMSEIKDKEGAKDKAKKIFAKAEIVIIRHGSTPLNSEDKVRGWIDVPLDEKGQKEAVKLGKKLSKENLDGLISSDLTRAIQTAGAISKEAEIPILEVTESFRPWNVGTLAGRSGKEAAPIMEDYARNKADESLDGGESFNEFRMRFLSAVKEAQDKYAGKKIGLVTHHRGDRILAAWEKKGEPKDYSVNIDTLFERGVSPGETRKEGEKINTLKDYDLS